MLEDNALGRKIVLKIFTTALEASLLRQLFILSHFLPAAKRDLFTKYSEWLGLW